MVQPAELLSYMRQREGDFIDLLGKVVELESPSLDKAATDKLVDFLSEHLTSLGCEVERVRQETYGDHLVARWWPAAAGPAPAEQVLILCHIDTVWAVGETARRPYRVEDGKAYGPGAMDMKGGVVQALMAIRTMRQLGIVPAKRVVLVFNTDEEVGSPTSRAVIEGEALRSEAVFVLEPPVGLAGKIKTFRKGGGGFEVRVKGKAAHAGADHQHGVNAILELAHQIVRIQNLTDYTTGTTLNVGTIEGGTRRNVVPADAVAGVDVRVSTKAESERVLKAMFALAPVNPAAEVAVTGGLNRPPMERTEKIVGIFRKAQAQAAELGLAIDETGTGGGSDGNFTAALGLPTLDGMGAVGEGGHAEIEYAVVSFMPERAALLVRMLQTI